MKRPALPWLLVASFAATLLASPAWAQDEPRRVFTLAVPAGSANAAFRAAVRALDGKHLRDVRIDSALADRSGAFVEGFFHGSLASVPVGGVVFAGTSGVAGVVMDRRSTLGRSLPDLLRELGRAMMNAPSGAAAVAPLRTVSYGSGTIGLPDSWQVTGAYQGCVEASSTRDGGYLALGCPQAAIVPPGYPGTDPAHVLVIPYATPVRALRDLAARPLPVGLGIGPLRILETATVPSPLGAGQGAYVLFDYSRGGGAFRGLALIAIAPPAESGAFVVYKSMFLLPAASFARLAPSLWQSWRSWGVSSGVLNDRMTAAAQSMRQAGDLITGSYWERQHAQAGSNAAFDQYIRDTATVERLETRGRTEIDASAAQAIVDGNPGRFRIVPAAELAPK